MATRNIYSVQINEPDYEADRSLVGGSWVLAIKVGETIQPSLTGPLTNLSTTFGVELQSGGGASDVHLMLTLVDASGNASITPFMLDLAVLDDQSPVTPSGMVVTLVGTEEI